MQLAGYAWPDFRLLFRLMAKLTPLQAHVVVLDSSILVQHRATMYCTPYGLVLYNVCTYKTRVAPFPTSVLSSSQDSSTNTAK